MKSIAVYINWVLFMGFVSLSVLFITWQAKNNLMMINESVAMIFLCLSLPAKIYKLTTVQYILFFTLIVLVFNSIRFSYTVVEDNVSTTYHSSQFNGIINPLVFIILIVFFVVNAGALIQLYQIITKGSKKEQQDSENKKIDFYYEQFNSCSEEELTSILKMYNDYPDEARIALTRIKSEKGIR